MLLRIIDKSWKIGLLSFLLIIGVSLLLVMVLNQNAVNLVYQPVLQYWSLFLILWQDNPVGAFEFIVSKSLIAFAHQDPRSGLNLWTFEIDSVTLFVYVLSSIAFAIVSTRSLRSKLSSRQVCSQNSFKIALVGMTLLNFSFSYMTAIEHCAGATWVGFVSAYGLGAEGFELYPYYQWVGAVIGTSCLGLALFLSRKGFSNNATDDSDTARNTYPQTNSSIN